MRMSVLMMLTPEVNAQFFIFILAALTSIASSQSVNFTDCGEGNVKDVRIFPCAGSNPCVIKLGTNVTVEADFVAPFSTNKLYEVIKGVIRGREMPFPEQRADPCNSGNIYPSCPIKQGERYQFKAKFEVKPFYPAISIKVKYSLTDPIGQKIACVVVATKIIDPNPSKAKERSRNRSKSHRNKANKSTAISAAQQSNVSTTAAISATANNGNNNKSNKN